jgi:hypothetical protein
MTKRAMALIVVACALVARCVFAGPSPAVEQVRFSALFAVSTDGVIVPKVPVKIGGAIMVPGTALSKDVAVGGTTLSTLVGKDLLILRTPTGVEVKGVAK